MSQLIDSGLTPRAVLNMTKAEVWLEQAEKYSDNRSDVIPEDFQSPAALDLYLPSSWTLYPKEPEFEEYYEDINIIQTIVRAAQELQLLQLPEYVDLKFQDDVNGWYSWVITGQRYGDLRLTSELLSLDDLYILCETGKLSGKHVGLMILKEATYQANIILSNLMYALELLFAETAKDEGILVRLADSSERSTREAVLDNPNSSEEAKVLATLHNMQGF